MIGLVLNEGGYVTYPYDVLKPVEDYVKTLNWRVTNVNCMGDGSGYSFPFEEQEDSFVDGETLLSMLQEHPKIQWVWGALSGFSKDIPWDEIRKNPIEDTKKQNYITKIASTAAEGDEIYDEANYPAFPIVPLWANEEHQSAIVGLREQIDCYDLIKSGFANNVDEASIVYWTLQNAGGMNDEDLAKFVQQMRDLHATVMDIDGAKAESHTIDVPWEAREKLLDRLNKDMYRDAMALDTENIADGATTATQIRAAYENLNSKCDKIEYQLIDWLNGIMAVAGIEDEPTFTRSQIINQTEMIGVLVTAGQFLGQDYIAKKILEVLGDGDRADEVLSETEQENIDRFTGGTDDSVIEE